MARTGCTRIRQSPAPDQPERRARALAHARLRSGGCCLAALLALFVSGAPLAEEPDWRVYRPAAGGFEVELHGEPEHRRRAERTLLGQVVHEYYSADRAGAKLEVERHTLPRLTTVFLSTEQLLDRVRDDLLEDVGAEAALEEPISLQGHPGRRLVYEREGPLPSTEESRLYLAGHTLFVVATGAYRPETRVPIVDRFFASFRIVESDLGVDAPAAD